MLLTGTHERVLDDKKRLTLPKRCRDQMGDPEVLFVTPGPDECLWIYTKEGLEDLAARVDAAPAADAEARVFRRLYFAQTEQVDVDRAGRILVPDRLGQFANLKHDVVLLGVRNHLELWDTERWKNYLAQHSPRFDSFAEGAMAGPKTV